MLPDELDADGALWGEYPPLTPRPGIFVDTKDFALPADRYVDAVKVDWEPLFQNSQLKVSVISRSGIHAGIPGGQPSTMHPMAGPWLSPKVVTEKSLPMVLPDMLGSWDECAR